MQTIAKTQRQVSHFFQRALERLGGRVYKCKCCQIAPELRAGRFTTRISCPKCHACVIASRADDALEKWNEQNEQQVNV